jgi:hypothetical protein
MLARSHIMLAIVVACLVQAVFLAVYFGLAGGGAITAAGPDLSPWIVTVVRITSFPGSSVPAGVFPDLPWGLILGIVVLLNVLVWSICIYLLLAFARRAQRHFRRLNASATA